MAEMARLQLEHKYAHSIEENVKLNRKLVSFQANKKTPFYNWFPYKEGFSADIVKLFINEYPKKNGLVLDPFSGTGTTLFSASSMGFDSVGIELLPIGIFVYKTREAANKVNLDDLLQEIEKLKVIDFSKSEIDEKIKFEHIRITEKAFPPETEKKLNAYLTYVNKVKDDDIKQLLKFACFGILEPISYTRKDGQYLRWDSRAKKGKANFNKGKIFSFEEALHKKLNQMANDINTFRLMPRTEKSNGIELRMGSCLEILPTVEANSFDLVISSPPYCNRYDYTRTYALELVFLGVSEDEIRELRQSMLSCTVENKDKVELLKAIYSKNGQKQLFEQAEAAFSSNEALQEILEILKNYKQENKLNNPGIYRMVKNYFYEHAFIIYEMTRVLKKGGRVYYVNDNVRYAGETIPVDLILSEFAQEAGLKVKKIYKLPKGKGNSSQQMGKHGREEVRKCVYCWEK